MPGRNLADSKSRRHRATIETSGVSIRAPYTLSFIQIENVRSRTLIRP